LKRAQLLKIYIFEHKRSTKIQSMTHSTRCTSQVCDWCVCLSVCLRVFGQWHLGVWNIAAQKISEWSNYHITFQSVEILDALLKLNCQDTGCYSSMMSRCDEAVCLLSGWCSIRGHEERVGNGLFFCVD